MQTITRNDLVRLVAAETGQRKDPVFDVITRTIDHIINEVAKGNIVELRNFGTFQAKLKKSRVGIKFEGRPGTAGVACGKKVYPAKVHPQFKPGEGFCNRVAALIDLVPDEYKVLAELPTQE